jgi:hypothetical protein
MSELQSAPFWKQARDDDVEAVVARTFIQTMPTCSGPTASFGRSSAQRPMDTDDLSLKMACCRGGDQSANELVEGSKCPIYLDPSSQRATGAA